MSAAPQPARPVRNRFSNCIIKGSPDIQVNIKGLRDNTDDIDWDWDWVIWISL